METISERPARDAAFGLLAAIVAEYEAAGRPAYGAPVKVALQRRSNGWFDEAKLGFSRFKGFLEAARDAGVVDFEETQGGDLRVFIRAQQPVVAPTAGPRAPFVRRDIWRAFFDWTAPPQRWYDLDRDQAVMLDSEAAVDSYLRGRSRARIIPIDPISVEMQLNWMREFAESAGEAGAELAQALETEHPLSEFTQAVRVAGLDRDWRDARQRRVVEVIDSWMAAHGVAIPLTEPRTERVGADGSLPSRPAEGEIRDMLHAAVDRMPVSELLRLPIPLEYLLP